MNTRPFGRRKLYHRFPLVFAAGEVTGSTFGYHRGQMARLLTAMMLVLMACYAAPTWAAAADLRVFQSHFYRVNTDIEPGLAQDLARRLDAMHEEYARRLMQFEPASDTEMVEAYLFDKQDDYLHFAGNAMRSTGGVYIPSRNALAAFNVGQGRDSLRRTLQHEAFHQFAANAFKTPLPMWLNEGMAQYFEEGLWTGDGFALAQVPPRRVRQLKADIRAKRIVPFDQFLTMTPEQWGKALGSHSSTSGATQYNQAWAMVHFLVNDLDASGRPRYRTRLVQLLQLIHAGSPADKAFVQAFSANYRGFQDRFLEWANKLEPNAEATCIERQEVLADMLMALRKYGITCTSIESFRSAAGRNQIEIQYSKGQIKWSTGKDTSIYFSRIDGKLMTADELSLRPRRGAPLPDIVSRCLPHTILRTRFYRSGSDVEHETLFEPADAPSTSRAPSTAMPQ